MIDEKTFADAERRTQEAGRRLVDREVVYCVSSLVSTLVSGQDNGGRGRDLRDLCEQAMEIALPIPNYTDAAIEDGAEVYEDCGEWDWRKGEESGGQCADTREEAARHYCEENRVEPHECEVYEHWIVSRWLADKLEAHGEKVDRDFAGMIVWARTTTGQAILLDGVIRDIVRELGWDKE